MFRKILGTIITMGALSTTALAAHALIVPMSLLNEDGTETAIGSLTITTARCGLLLSPNLHGLTPGAHGFHIHEHASCAEKGMAAGGHFDPRKTNAHNGPYAKQGHLGDLPLLIVDKNGDATVPVLAPRLRMKQLKDHAIMIHVGSDNYADHPEKLGGGGARMACGIVK